MTHVISIREYQPNDKNHLIDLIRLNSPEYFAVAEEADFIHYLDHERESYYVLLFDQQIVGCGGINYTDNNTTAKISWDIIHPNYQGKSFGSKLLKFRLDTLKTRDNIQNISVRTSQVAYKFYEKHGFELITVKKDYWAEGFDLYHMILNITVPTNNYVKQKI